MKTLHWIRLTIAAGICSLLAGGLSHLALTDIARAEPDVTGEWLTLQVAAVVIIGFHVITFVTLRKVTRAEPAS